MNPVSGVSEAFSLPFMKTGKRNLFVENLEKYMAQWPQKGPWFGKGQGLWGSQEGVPLPTVREPNTFEPAASEYWYQMEKQTGQRSRKM